MRDVDVNSKAFFAIPRNFADLVNGVLFEGHPVVDPKDLEPTGTEFISDDEMKSFFVDVAKLWILKNVKGSLIIVEDQNYIDYGMVIRNMRTELLSYIKQVNEIKDYHKAMKDLRGDEFLSGISKHDLLSPSVTIVVYLGEEPWNGPRQLYDILDMDEKLALAVNNYKLNLFDYHDCEDLSVFKGEIRKLIEVLKIRDDKNAIREYVNNNRYMERATGELMNSLIGVKCANNVINTLKGDVIDMCKGLEELCKDCREEGMEQGLEQGIKNLVKSCKELTNSREITVQQLVKQYDLSKEVAEEHLGKYW